MSIDTRSAWICEECRNKIPKGDNTNIPVRPAQQSSGAGRTSIPIRPVKQQTAAGRGKPRKTPSTDAVIIVPVNAPTSPRDTSSPKSDTSSTPAYNGTCSSISFQDVDDNAPITRKILKDIIADEIGITLRSLALEQKQIREVVDSFQQAISFFSNRYDELKTTLEEKSDKIDRLEKENISLHESVQNLTKRINISEQHARSSNIEIQCVPENKSENLVSTILHLGEEIKCDVADTDIVHCTRVAKKDQNNTRPRSILVKFSNPRQRDSFLAAATKYNRTHPKNRLNSSHLRISAKKPQPIYVVEHLSAENKSLHAAARAHAIQLGIRI